MSRLSFNSSVLIWLNPEQGVNALVERAKKTQALNPALRPVGYFGSYAPSDWGVRSDLDVAIVVGHSKLPFERWAMPFHLNDLSVVADVLADRYGSGLGTVDQPWRGKTLWEEVS